MKNIDTAQRLQNVMLAYEHLSNAAVLLGVSPVTLAALVAKGISDDTLQAAANNQTEKSGTINEEAKQTVTKPSAAETRKRAEYLKSSAHKKRMKALHQARDLYFQKQKKKARKEELARKKKSKKSA